MSPELHLSEAELYQELDQPEGLAAEGHLVNCAQCRAEVAGVRASLTGLRMAAAALAESHFRPHLEIPQPRAWSRMRAWPLSLAAAGVLLAASLTLVHHPANVGPADGAKTQAVVEPAASTDTDDALLDGIDRDLSTSVAPSLAPLDVTATDGAENAAKVN